VAEGEALGLADGEALVEGNADGAALGESVEHQIVVSELV